MLGSGPIARCVDRPSPIFRMPYEEVVPYVAESVNRVSLCVVTSTNTLTDCANTLCKNTCMTTDGFGKTAFTICASVSTVPLISVNNSANPSSVLGGVVSAFGNAFHLHRELNPKFLIIKKRHQQDCIILGQLIPYIVDEEIMLIDVNLNARRSAIELEQRLRAMLRLVSGIWEVE